MSNEEHNKDFALIKRFRKGESGAVDILVSKYQDRLYNVIYKMCRNHDDAMELTQDSFVKAIENVGSFQGKSTFYTYLFRIGVNLTINFCNRKNKVRFTTMEATASSEEGAPVLRDYLHSTREIDPHKAAENKESVEILREAIAELDEKYRTVLVLRDIEEMSYEDISSTLKLEAGTVKSRLFRARMQLKDKLSAVFEDLE